MIFYVSAPSSETVRRRSLNRKHVQFFTDRVSGLETAYTSHVGDSGTRCSWGGVWGSERFLWLSSMFLTIIVAFTRVCHPQTSTNVLWIRNWAQNNASAAGAGGRCCISNRRRMQRAPGGCRRMHSPGGRTFKNFGNSSRGRRQELPKIFRAPIGRIARSSLR